MNVDLWHKFKEWIARGSIHRKKKLNPQVVKERKYIRKTTK